MTFYVIIILFIILFFCVFCKSFMNIYISDSRINKYVSSITTECRLSFLDILRSCETYECISFRLHFWIIFFFRFDFDIKMYFRIAFVSRTESYMKNQLRLVVLKFFSLYVHTVKSQLASISNAPRFQLKIFEWLTI